MAMRHLISTARNINIPFADGEKKTPICELILIHMDGKAYEVREDIKDSIKLTETRIELTLENITDLRGYLADIEEELEQAQEA